MKFSDLKLSSSIQKALLDLNYETPTPIQEKAIPIILEQKDLLGCAQTGTGKTAAFALPILHILEQRKQNVGPRQVHTLILTPTRELAIQIYDNFKDYGKYMNLKMATAYGGVGIQPQIRALQNGVDVLVATPGRLLDLIVQRHLMLNKVQMFVLDEADRMLDMGFIQDIKRIIPLLPSQRHSLFFSATMPSDILKLAQTILKNPEQVAVTPVATTAEKINQSVMYVDRPNKRELLKHLLNSSELKKVIVFTRTKFGANRVAEILQKLRITAAAIHGNKSQSARQKALEGFRDGQIRVLIATDIVARGIDVDGITHVINYEIPNQPESYVHRIGRTARAGAEGIAISFCELEEKSFIRDIEKTIGLKIPVVVDHPYHSKMVEQAGIVSSGKAKAMIEQKEKKSGAHRSSNGKKRFRPGGRSFKSKAQGKNK